MQTQLLNLLRSLRDLGYSVSLADNINLLNAINLLGFKQEYMEDAFLCILAKDKESYFTLPILLQHYLIQLQSQHNTIIPPFIEVEKIYRNPPRLSDDIFNYKLHEIKNCIRRDIDIFNSITTATTCEGKFSGVSPIPIKSYKNGIPNLSRIPNPVRLWEIDIALADTEQIKEIKKIILKLGRHLATGKGYLKKPSSNGSIDIRKTARRAMATGGVPFILKKQKYTPSRPYLVVMCDFSGSVAPYSQFFTQLLCGMQSSFKSIRILAFVDHLEDITDRFKLNWQPTSDISAREILREAKISLTGFSNYGRVWEIFSQNFMHLIKPQTSLVILGDARNNWQPEGVEYLEKIRQHCKRIIWLNPLPSAKWNQDDCIINAYLPYCNSAHECRNAAQLAVAIKNIL